MVHQIIWLERKGLLSVGGREEQKSRSNLAIGVKSSKKYDCDVTNFKV